MKKETLNVIIRWTARLTGAALFAFFAFMFFSYLFNGEPVKEAKPISRFDILQLSLMWLSVIGLLAAWKWERMGALVTLAAYLIHAAILPSVFEFPYLFVALIALLFLASWWMSRKR